MAGSLVRGQLTASDGACQRDPLALVDDDLEEPVITGDKRSVPVIAQGDTGGGGSSGRDRPTDGVAAGEIPDPDGPVVGCGEDEVIVRGHARDPTTMAFPRSKPWFQVRPVEYAYDPAGATGDHRVTVGSETHRRDGVVG